MLRKMIVTLAAAAAVAATLAPAAQAKTNIDFNVNLGVGGYVGSPGYYVVDDGWYEEDCTYVKVKHKKVLKSGKVKVWFTKELVCG